MRLWTRVGDRSTGSNGVLLERHGRSTWAFQGGAPRTLLGGTSARVRGEDGMPPPRSAGAPRRGRRGRRSAMTTSRSVSPVKDTAWRGWVHLPFDGGHGAAAADFARAVTAGWTIGARMRGGRSRKALASARTRDAFSETAWIAPGPKRVVCGLVTPSRSRSPALLHDPKARPPAARRRAAGAPITASPRPRTVEGRPSRRGRHAPRPASMRGGLGSGAGRGTDERFRGQRGQSLENAPRRIGTTRPVAPPARASAPRSAASRRTSRGRSLHSVPSDEPAAAMTSRRRCRRYSELRRRTIARSRSGCRPDPRKAARRGADRRGPAQ